MAWAHCRTDWEGREIGYSVDAICDQEGCEAKIDRGLGYCCGGMHGGGDSGCGKYFCDDHLGYAREGGPHCKSCSDFLDDDDEDDESEEEVS